jgi:hypothetical protein
MSSLANYSRYVARTVNRGAYLARHQVTQRPGPLSEWPGSCRCWRDPPRNSRPQSQLEPGTRGRWRCWPLTAHSLQNELRRPTGPPPRGQPWPHSLRIGSAQRQPTSRRGLPLVDLAVHPGRAPPILSSVSLLPTGQARTESLMVERGQILGWPPTESALVNGVRSALEQGCVMSATQPRTSIWRRGA